MADEIVVTPEQLKAGMLACGFSESMAERATREEIRVHWLSRAYRAMRVLEPADETIDTVCPKCGDFITVECI
jgi:hypothetical protein